MGWGAEDKFGGKTADGDGSAADGVKEGGVGRGMWSRHTFSPACLEPTRTGVGSPGAKIESEVGMRRHEPEV